MRLQRHDHVAEFVACGDHLRRRSVEIVGAAVCWVDIRLGGSRDTYSGMESWLRNTFISLKAFSSSLT
jgi:hypothetical protein